MTKYFCVLLKSGFVAAVSLLACTATIAQEQEVDFSYLEFRFVDDGASRSGVSGGDGPMIGGSFQLSPDWLVFGSYGTREYGILDFEEYEVGGGMILRGLLDFDLIATGAVVKREVSGTFNAGTIFRRTYSESDTGLRVSVGVREFFTNHFFSEIEALDPLELRASVNVEHVGDFDAFLEGGADYHFFPGFSAGLELQLGGDAEVVSVGIRWFY